MSAVTRTSTPRQAEGTTPSPPAQVAQAVSSRKRRQPAIRSVASAVLPPLALALVIGTVWQIAAMTAFAGRSYMLPAPAEVWNAAVTNAELIGRSMWVTFSSAVIAYTMSVVIAVTAAVAMSRSTFIERSVYPFAVGIQVTPVVSVIPIIILWFGFGMRSIVVSAGLIAFFPVLSNTLLGLRSVDPGLVDLFRLHRSGAAQRFFRLELPSALPQIVAGMRISAGLGVIGVITGEFLIGTAGTYGGIGVRIVMAQATMQTALMFACVFAASALGLIFFWIVSGAGNRMLKSWHTSARTRD